MNDQYIKLIGGLAFIIFGIGAIWKRDAYARWNAKSIRALWGAAAEPVAKSSKPGTLVFVAIVFLVMGLVFVVTSIASLAS